MTAFAANLNPKVTSSERDFSKNQHWQEVAMELSAAVAEPLTLALERVQKLARTGRIEQADLRALYGEILEARRVSMAGQQLARLASGRLRQTHERVRLATSLQEVLALHAKMIRKRNITLKTSWGTAEVLIDASLLFNLLDSMVFWFGSLATSEVELRVDVKVWPANARLLCRFAYGSVDATEESLNTVTWRVIEQTAWTLGLTLSRQAANGKVDLTLEFPRTVNDQLEGVSAIELDQGLAPEFNTKPLAGTQILVVASRREMRVKIREAIQDMGLVVDFVNSVDEAREFCMGGLPNAMVIEAALGGDRLTHLRQEIEGSGSQMAFVEILEEGNGFEISDFSALSMAKVGRDAIVSSLPSALVFELSKMG
jgi:hypothetical protein